MKVYGNVFRYGDNINTDVIIPARYLNVSAPAELAAHCMEDLDSNFIHKVRAGDIVVGGKNFGCGSSREHAPIALFAAGIRLVIAESFSRIFFRNAINTGLAILECPAAACEIADGDLAEADLDTGLIRDITKNTEYTAAPFPPFITEIINAGGLINYLTTKENTK